MRPQFPIVLIKFDEFSNLEIGYTVFRCHFADYATPLWPFIIVTAARRRKLQRYAVFGRTNLRANSRSTRRRTLVAWRGKVILTLIIILRVVSIVTSISLIILVIRNAYVRRAKSGAEWPIMFVRTSIFSFVQFQDAFLYIFLRKSSTHFKHFWWRGRS